MAIDRSHGNITKPDLVDELIDSMAPSVLDVIDRLDADEFTTTEFIGVMLTDDDARRAYDDALRRWGEGEHSSKMVIHGQVIPAILRRADRLEWAGYAHGVDDPYAVPAWWTMRQT